jgi:hypothetical protein
MEHCYISMGLWNTVISAAFLYWFISGAHRVANCEESPLAVCEGEVRADDGQQRRKCIPAAPSTVTNQ